MPEYNPRQRKLFRIVAAIVVTTFGVSVCWDYGNYPGYVAGSILLVIGATFVVLNGVAYWKSRPGRYDLTKLRLIDDTNGVEPDRYERTMIYCHRCDGSVPDNYSICPECGNPLGT